ncbi:DUF4296 domain-containing protein [Fluviicola sp.]|uniref:DUF4296 domain-containing protein n=1 Tax=Fluviicola sp. TaxID=1917219 RepID=UPI0028269003|nr:DUF4296 domain-containing protein [Fluviicola sp.]MDR0802517.1 DUF4296 domain-containing protein [Fluviicola sp.]
MRIFALITLLLVVQSCDDKLRNPEKPDNLIPKEQMIEVMTNMLILEGYIQNTYSTVNRYYKVMTASGRDYLKTQGITQKQYEDSFLYYNSMEQDYDKMLDKVMERLQKESIELQKNREPSDSLS